MQLVCWRVHLVDTLLQVCAATVDPSEVRHDRFNVIPRDGILLCLENIEGFPQVGLDRFVQMVRQPFLGLLLHDGLLWLSLSLHFNFSGLKFGVSFKLNFNLKKCVID